MNHNKFDGEVQYQLAMYFVKKLRSDGMIFDEEYKKADRILLEKYKPVISMLLNGGGDMKNGGKDSAGNSRGS